MKRSSPAPPINRSSPSPPRIRSLPAPPFSVCEISTPSAGVSLPANVSLPASPFNAPNPLR
ncbi:MAG: hypothetical protein FJ295_19805 [Planctomycetes bacterium]|nr:hypothetical protein [Planctomycetota bacterium]